MVSSGSSSQRTAGKVSAPCAEPRAHAGHTPGTRAQPAQAGQPRTPASPQAFRPGVIHDPLTTLLYDDYMTS
jgi:hypothetical protein